MRILTNKIISLELCFIYFEFKGVIIFGPVNSSNDIFRHFRSHTQPRVLLHYGRSLCSVRTYGLWFTWSFWSASNASTFLVSLFVLTSMKKQKQATSKSKAIESERKMQVFRTLQHEEWVLQAVFRSIVCIGILVSFNTIFIFDTIFLQKIEFLTRLLFDFTGYLYISLYFRPFQRPFLWRRKNYWMIHLKY